MLIPAVTDINRFCSAHVLLNAPGRQHAHGQLLTAEQAYSVAFDTHRVCCSQHRRRCPAAMSVCEIHDSTTTTPDIPGGCSGQM
jgi:hypothetical protein